MGVGVGTGEGLGVGVGVGVGRGVGVGVGRGVGVGDGVGVVVLIRHRRLLPRLDGRRIIWTGPASSIDDPGEAHVAQFVKGSRDGPITMELRR